MEAANDNGLRFLSVCSGIEAASVAWNPIGWVAAAFSEIEKFPSAVLAHHYPGVPNLGDFTKIDVTTLGRIDILSGGTPCQAFSVAGLRNSLADARGNLSMSFVRLAHELAGIAENGPEQDRPVLSAGNGLRNVVWENVPGVLSTIDNAFGCFLGALVGADDAVVPSPPPGERQSNQHWRWDRQRGRHITKWPNAGMVSGAKGRAAWRVLDAQFFGLAQRRRRVIVVADFGNGADPAAVLFERFGVQGNTPPSREARKDVAPTISARTKGGGGLGTDFDLDGGLVEAAVLRGHADYGAGLPSLRASGGDAGGGSEALAYAPEIARCDATREGSSQDYETTTMVAVAATLTATYGKQSGQDMMAENMLALGHIEPVCVTGTVTHTLKAEGFDASEDGTGRGQPIVAHALDARQSAHPPAIAFSSKDHGGDATEELSPTLRAGNHSGSHANAGTPPAVTVAIRGRDGGATAEIGGEVATALAGPQGGGDKPHVLTSAVRRLTPRECERLMGFPDGYTDIPWRGKPASPDGPRYKALGNSWAVPKFHWLGKRIQRLMPNNREAA